MLVSVEESAPRSGEPAAPSIVVLLVDDQPLIARAMRDMLRTEPDMELHVCPDPRQATSLAVQLSPSIILLDLAMPHMDGLTLLKRLRSDPATCEIPIVVLSGRTDSTIKACAFDQRATDYLVKLPDRIELIARIRHHSTAHNARLESNRTKQVMDLDVGQAAKYVRSLLPPPLAGKHVRVDWRFVPSAQLGGDALGFHWLDSEHLAIYMLDVIGHGIGASLMAVSVLTTLSQQTLPSTDFKNPSAVMSGLNRVFRMDRHGDRFFTIWYGVYSVWLRTLTFSGGGHPPPFLFHRQEPGDFSLDVLPPCGPPIGIADECEFENTAAEITPGSRLLLYSDGAFEIPQPNGVIADGGSFNDFVSATGPADDLMERILDRARQIRGSEALGDDCSLIQVEFS